MMDHLDVTGCERKRAVVMERFAKVANKPCDIAPVEEEINVSVASSFLRRLSLSVHSLHASSPCKTTNKACTKAN